MAKKHVPDATDSGRSRWWFWIIAGVFLAVSGYGGTFSPLVRIDHVTVRGAETVLEENVVHYVRSVELEKNAMWFLPGDNIIVASSETIQESIKKQFPIFGRVVVTKRFPKELVIDVEERTAVVVWCQDQQRCHIVDESGITYMERPMSDQVIEDPTSVLVRDESAEHVSVGDRVISPEMATFLSRIQKILEQESGVRLRREMRMTSRHTPEVVMEAEDGWRLLVHREIPIATTARTIASLLENQLSFDDREKLEYIDVRYPNKIFFRMNGDEQRELDEAMQENRDEEKTHER